MKTTEALLLSREDLFKEHQNLKIEEISFFHFKPHVVETIKFTSIVIFIDENLTSKILKNRYASKHVVSE